MRLPRQSTTLRFSSRVENYIKYRPSYPNGVIETLVTHCGLTEKSVVADIGSGTGILSELFLKNGNRVFGVEPNREMREAGERLLKRYDRFSSIDGTAEGTTLADRSVDFITVGQAFHWFDRERARKEFARVLAPRGWAVIIWNVRQTETTSFLRAYEQLLQKYGTDYAAVDHRNVDATAMAAFFAPHTFTLREFENEQVFDFDGVKGRLLSSSYAPESGHPNHQPMLDALRAIFDTYQTDDRINFVSVTQMYFGHIV
ncbi:MAG TPA: class I SAM-dependent methyltransferase [Verrucomicrobiae bacterium]|nr:class I SAM-dependent methyltransferase [Verrucomicrobiae bacterium]